jgi:hypothetical protein
VTEPHDPSHEGSWTDAALPADVVGHEWRTDGGAGLLVLEHLC